MSRDCVLQIISAFFAMIDALSQLENWININAPEAQAKFQFRRFDDGYNIFWVLRIRDTCGDGWRYDWEIKPEAQITSRSLYKLLHRSLPGITKKDAVFYAGVYAGVHRYSELLVS